MKRYQHILLVALITVFLSAWSPLSPKLPARGKISLPARNASVSSPFYVSGTIANLQPGNHLYILVKINNTFWAKDELILSGNSWYGWINEGTKKPFTIALCLADPKSHAKIQAWLRKGAATGSFPGKSRAYFGCKILDRVNLTSSR